MKTLASPMLIMAAVLLSGCDGRPETEPQPAALFKEERETLDKAKGVQQTIDRQAEEQRKKIEEAEKGQ